MRVLIFGASSTQGYWDRQGGWADRLKKHYDEVQLLDLSKDIPHVMNLGISGDTTENLMRRIENEIRARQNAKGICVLIQIGTNNAAETNGQPRSTPQSYQRELTLIVEKTKRFTDKILIVGFPAVDEAKTTPIAWADLHYKNEAIAQFEAVAGQVAAEQGVGFVPLHQAMLSREGEYLQSGDGLHPNDAGHQLIFELVLPPLDSLLNT